MSAAGWLVVVVLLIVTVTLLVAVMPWFRLAMRAHGDFEDARGTLQRREIERALGPLGLRLADARATVARVETDLAADAGQERSDIDRALADHLVRTRLDDVPGVGAARVESIRAGVFRGQLRDLLGADNLPGIGPQTAAAIAAWVAEQELDWLNLLRTEFPAKTDIVAAHIERRAILDRERLLAEREIARWEEIEGAARPELERLCRVSPATFRRSLRGGDPPPELQSYTLGVFPPWATPPPWYTAMLELGNPASGG